MKKILKFAAAVAAVSAAVDAVIAYRDEVAAFMEKCVDKFKSICPCSRIDEENDFFADMDE